jgi:hypothetical protein
MTPRVATRARLLRAFREYACGFAPPVPTTNCRVPCLTRRPLVFIGAKRS